MGKIVTKEQVAEKKQEIKFLQKSSKIVLPPDARKIREKQESDLARITQFFELSK